MSKKTCTIVSGRTLDNDLDPWAFEREQKRIEERARFLFWWRNEGYLCGVSKFAKVFK